jgi:hypothetical protein
MQVIPPNDFARMVFGASGGRNTRPLVPQYPAFFRQQAVPQFFHVPPLRPEPRNSGLEEMTQKVRFLEREVRRFTEELKIRVEISRRERMVRNALKEECEELRDEVARLRSVLHAREREIYDLERQLRASQNQLVLMKRKFEAASTAVSRKGSPVPGSISSLPKDMRSIGTQVTEINELEERIDRLSSALMVEKERNRRIKSMLITEHVSAMPPLPVSEERSRSQPPVRRRPFTTHWLAGKIVIQKPQAPILTQQIFLELNANPEPPPAPEFSPPPMLLSPIKKSGGYQFQIFEDKENSGLKNNANPSSKILASSSTLNRANVMPEIAVSPALKPPPFVPQLNLATLRQPAAPANDSSARSTQSTSSEAAIKRAVAAAIEKRKQLANQGVSLGSGRSSILGSSSFMSNSPINVSGVKARFCIPLG